MLYRLPVITSYIQMDLLSVNQELDYSEVHMYRENWREQITKSMSCRINILFTIRPYSLLRKNVQKINFHNFSGHVLEERGSIPGL